jgi:hypothetical protein
MKINISVEGEKDKEEMILTDDELDNWNFVEMIVGDSGYIVSVDDLYEAILTFKRRKDERIKADKERS